MILLVRHGQTFWNRERRIQGRSESELTPLGERQAAAMASLVADIVRRDDGPSWRLVSSPIGRAVQTATAISRAADLPIELDPRLAEIACGDWEGRLWDDVSASFRIPYRAMSGSIWPRAVKPSTRSRTASRTGCPASRTSPTGA